MRNFKYKLNKEFVETGKTPFVKYNCIKEDAWEAFVKHRQSEQAKAKSKKFKELAKKNEIPHHLGNIGYAGHKPGWRAEERARAQTGEPDPLPDCDERSRDYVYAHKPKKLKEGKIPKPHPKIEEAEKAIIAVTQGSKSGSFEIRRGKDVLTEALGNPEHRGRVRGMSSRMSWNTVGSWQTDGATYHTRDRYKEGLRQEGREEAMKEMISKSIVEAFTSNDPKMVEIRSQMFRQAGVPLMMTPATGQLVQTAGTPSRSPLDEITEITKCTLLVPFGRGERRRLWVKDLYTLPTITSTIMTTKTSLRAVSSSQ
jgi:hypothetical protein